MSKLFSRFIFIFIIIFLFSMVFYKFYIEEPNGELNDGVIFLIGFMTLLVIAEFLNQYSVGAIVHYQIRLEDKNKVIKQHKNENKRLLKKILESYKSDTEIPKSIRPIAELHLANVIKSKQIIHQEDLFMIHPKIQNEGALNKLKSYILSKFFEPHSKTNIHIVEKVEIELPENTIDSIGNLNPVFDGYYENDTEEIFVSIAFFNAINECFYNRLYVALSRLYWYQQCKDKRIILKVIFVDITNNEEEKSDLYIDSSTFSSFLPAIKSGLLHFDYLTILDKEVYLAINPIFKT